MSEVEIDMTKSNIRVHDIRYKETGELPYNIGVPIDMTKSNALVRKILEKEHQESIKM